MKKNLRKLTLFYVLIYYKIFFVICQNEKGIVSIPGGSTEISPGGHILHHITCNPPPPQSITIITHVQDNKKDKPYISPVNITISHPNDNATFRITGIGEGRFIVLYSLVGPNANIYELSTHKAVILVSNPDEGWRGIWYQLVLNVSIFLIGFIHFIWRRSHKSNVPFWKGHVEGLFERIDQMDLNDYIKYHAIIGNNTKERFKAFLKVPCDGAYVASRCGINAALTMRFHADCGHFFAFLTIFSIGVILPVNYLSGESDVKADKYQRTTISNVPLYSNWYWVHVAYCYVIAIGVIYLIERQYILFASLQRRTREIIGAKSVFVKAGLPKNITKYELRNTLDRFFPGLIHDVVILHDLSKLYQLLNRRISLHNEYHRLQEIDKRSKYGNLPCCLIWCPGGGCIPNIFEVFWHYVTCRPCRLTVNSNNEVRTNGYIEVNENETEALGYPNMKQKLQSIKNELDSFPKQAMHIYKTRQGTGSAFIVFNTISSKREFIRSYKELSLTSRRTAVFRGIFDTFYGTIDETNNSVLDIHPTLKSLVLTAAPEPSDLKWYNLNTRPMSLLRYVQFTFYHAVTITILLIFSTPTAVLNYINLDYNSSLYKRLHKQGSFFLSLLANYLPALLLIIVNWLLLTFLFYLSEFEPWHSESKRMRSFMSKGFSYLLLSSIVLPSIGVTALYLEFGHVSQSTKSYVEQFMYRISGTFFITYVCQRTFLGSIIQLLRLGERILYQPWLISRAVTTRELKEAYKPWPFYFGHDYAVILSVYMVTLGGTVITPLIAPFGALYYYLKLVCIKYNFLYVVPYTPGRGDIAKSAYAITFFCLLIFEMIMGTVFLEVAGNGAFCAMIVLFSLTLVYGMSRRVGLDQLLYKIAIQDYKKRDIPRSSEYIPESRESAISIAEEDENMVLDSSNGQMKTYRDPYENILAIYVLSHFMRKKQMENAFKSWKIC